jgi:hypothetical protein
MKYYISNLTTKGLIKGMLLCAVFALGLSELAQAGTSDDPPPPLAPPVSPTIAPPHRQRLLLPRHRTATTNLWMPTMSL